MQTKKPAPQLRLKIKSIESKATPYYDSNGWWWEDGNGTHVLGCSQGKVASVAFY